MRIYKANIAQGIGDNIMVKCCADMVKHKYDAMYFTHDTFTVNLEKKGGKDYWKFLFGIGKLFFSEPPYVYKQGEHKFRGTHDLIRDFGIILQKPQLAVYQPLLCKGNSLNLGKEYIVLTTKVRELDKIIFYKLLPQFCNIINLLSHKYKIVILGEREIEMSANYLLIGKNQVFSIYEQIIANINPDSIIDLTIPVLGITSPDLDKLRQDCLIMKEAKLVVTIGVGGNFCMGLAVANTIGYRKPGCPDWVADMMCDKPQPDCFVTKNWNDFSNKLKEYL